MCFAFTTRLFDFPLALYAATCSSLKKKKKQLKNKTQKQKTKHQKNTDTKVFVGFLCFFFWEGVGFVLIWF